MIHKKDSETTTMKMTRPWTGKKEKTNPKKKEQHENRKTKKATLHQIKDEEWLQQVRDYVGESKTRR